VIVKVLLPGGETRERIIPRSSIEEIRIPVDEKRLAQLRPQDPGGYRDYAEDLVEKREDPDARATAIRLYLIAASLDPPGLGRSCMLGMAALARSPDEERRFNAMAYLLDRGHDPALLKSPSSPAMGDGIADSDRKLLRNLLRLLRTREIRQARTMMSRPSVQKALERVAPLIQEDELKAAVAPMLSPGLLRKILTVELLLSGVAPPSEPVDATATTRRWSRAVARDGAKPVSPLTLETLTEFDPRQRWFRDGKWTDVEPPSS
jgi:hypothetical protein